LDAVRDKQVRLTHFPQLHDVPLPDLTDAGNGVVRDIKEPIKRFQFELAKRILEEVRVDPHTAIFVEGALHEFTHESFIQEAVHSFLGQVAERHGDVYVVKPELTDWASDGDNIPNSLRAILKMFASAIRVEVQNDKLVSVIGRAEACKTLVELSRKSFGIEDGFPERFEDANDLLRHALCEDGLKVLLATGYINRLYPLEREETHRALAETQSRWLFGEHLKTMDGFAPVPHLLSSMAISPEQFLPLVMGQREADASQIVADFLKTDAGKETAHVIVVYGARHDFQDDFECFGHQVTRDPELDELSNEGLKSLQKMLR
jgi:hypothetical protein